MRDFWPFFVIFCAIFGIFVVLDVTRIVPHACIAHVSCFQFRLRMSILSMVRASMQGLIVLHIHVHVATCTLYMCTITKMVHVCTQFGNTLGNGCQTKKQLTTIGTV